MRGFFLLFIIVLISCGNSIDEKLKKELIENNCKVISYYGSIEDTQFVVINSDDKVLKNTKAYLVVLDNENEIKAYHKIKFDRRHYKYLYLDDYFVFTKDIYFYVYSKDNKFLEFVDKNGYIGNFIIANGQLIYSTEKTANCIRRFDLSTNEEYLYESNGFHNSPFYLFNDKVYTEKENVFYEVQHNDLIVSDLEIDNKYLIEKNIVKQGSIFQAKINQLMKILGIE